MDSTILIWSYSFFELEKSLQFDLNNTNVHYILKLRESFWVSWIQINKIIAVQRCMLHEANQSTPAYHLNRCAHLLHTSTYWAFPKPFPNTEVISTHVEFLLWKVYWLGKYVYGVIINMPVEEAICSLS
jgi:hypothetical protein